MIKIGFLVSGNGGSLKFIHQISNLMKLPIHIVFVAGDRECGATKYSTKELIPTNIIKYTKNNPDELQQLLNSYDSVDFVITNIHKIIDRDTLNIFNGKFINLHYSMLPAYNGLIGMETVKKAREDNVAFLGTTCHEVSEVLDGGRIIAQSCFPVNWEDDDNFIVEQVFRSASICLLNGILLKSGYKYSYVTKTYKSVLYNPPLEFKTDLINDNFWRSLKES